MRQQDLASELGCSRQHIGRVETGTAEYSFSQIQKISEIIGIPVCSFFDGYIHIDTENITPWMTDYMKQSTPTRRRIDQIVGGILNLINS
ncbi:MAG: helix-turn-helix transcriptional regulator [Oceanobacter sp.]